MRKLVYSLSATFAVASILMAHASEGKHHGSGFYGHGFSITTSNDSASEVCSDHIKVRDSMMQEMAEGEELRTLPNAPLKINASSNGSIHVRTWDKGEISVKLCKVVVSKTADEAKSVLSKLALSVAAGEINVKGPANWDEEKHSAWSTVILVHAPRGAQLDLSAQNGGISLDQVDAKVHAHAQNGGISLKQAKGTLDLEAENGGISIKDSGGNVTVDVENGGVHLELGEQWLGGTLVARLRNGGLVVEIPEKFQSALEISGSSNSPVVCKTDICSQGNRTWDENGRVFKIGTGAPVVKASTINGGIVIRRRGQHDGDDEMD